MRRVWARGREELRVELEWSGTFDVLLNQIAVHKKNFSRVRALDMSCVAVCCTPCLVSLKSNGEPQKEFCGDFVDAEFSPLSRRTTDR